MKRILPLLLIALTSTAADAISEEDLLRVEEAFTYETTAEIGHVVVRLRAEPGYYLYRKRFAFESLSDGISLGEPVFPAGEIHEDEFFGRQEIYRGDFSIRLPYTREASSGEIIELQLKLQGCADIGLCYPPQTWTDSVELPAAPPATPGTNLLARLAEESGSGTGEFLPVDEAFRFSARMVHAGWLELDWQIADGYYLYRDKLTFTPTREGVRIAAPTMPDGTLKNDEYFGEMVVYFDTLSLRLPVSVNEGRLELDVGYQGCAEDGICYPPQVRHVSLDPVTEVTSDALVDDVSAPVSEQDRLAGLIRSGALPWVIAAFFGFGLLLAFTPCVLPMVPILSSIIVGQGDSISTGRAFTLSLVYVLAMALTYTVAGVIAALAGQNLQAAFQHPVILAAFSAVFVALALAMFGVYELQMPAALQSRLSSMSQRQKGGTLLGAGVMGVLSALIVGPCVAAPLAAALIVIGQSGDPLRGGSALFALSLGMGAPLLAFGASAGTLLPKAGPWMNAVKAAFGVLLLGVAIWMLQRIIPASLSLVLWAALAGGTGVFMGAFTTLGETPTTARKLGKGVGLLAVVYAILLLIGAASGGSDPLRPLTGGLLGGKPEKGLEFTLIKTTADLDSALAQAVAEGRLTMLDFYADWCVDCKKMERYTFHDPAVLAALDDAVLLQADVTANDKEDQALLQRFDIFGPPTIAFFDANGEEIRGVRQVGYAPADEFVQLIDRARKAFER